MHSVVDPDLEACFISLQHSAFQFPVQSVEFLVTCLRHPSCLLGHQLEARRGAGAQRAARRGSWPHGYFCWCLFRASSCFFCVVVFLFGVFSLFVCVCVSLFFVFVFLCVCFLVCCSMDCSVDPTPIR